MRPQQLIAGASLVFLLMIAGCAGMESSSDTAATDTASGIARNEPYFPTKFNDFEIPGELTQERRESMFINTSSFTGGILYFTGRVEIGSLTDYFVNSMQKHGWKLVGEVRYENIMLAFNKPNKSCMITIYAGDFMAKTKVYAYITEDVIKSPTEQNL